MAGTDLQGQVDDLTARLEAMETAFTGQGETGREGGEGQGGEKGEAGEPGQPGAEVDKEGNVTETFVDEVNKNGETESPVNESKLEKKGGITKKNLKSEAEKEGFSPGGGGGPGKWEAAGVGHKITQSGAGKKSTAFTPSATQGMMLRIRVEVENAASTATVLVGGVTVAGLTVKTGAISLVNSFMVYVPKGQVVTLEVLGGGGSSFAEAEVASELAGLE